MQLGIVASEYNLDGNSFFGIQTNYLRFISLFGNPELITGTTLIESMQRLDGIFLPGGPDVNPMRYNEKTSYWTGKPSQHLEYFDTVHLPKLIGKIPIIGICRGLQTINVALGGTLEQHIDYRKNDYSEHEKDLVHEVFTGEGKKFKVNSFHHQGIKKLSNQLEPIAKNKHGLVEAVYSEPLRIFAVQWHPERMERDAWTEQHIWKVLAKGG